MNAKQKVKTHAVKLKQLKEEKDGRETSGENTEEVEVERETNEEMTDIEEELDISYHMSFRKPRPQKNINARRISKRRTQKLTKDVMHHGQEHQTE